MAVIHYQGVAITLAQNQTALEALLGAGFDIPNACRAGACQSCKMQASEGVPPRESQLALMETEKKLGYFLACQCRPSDDLTLNNLDSAALKESKILERSVLSPTVLRLRLTPPFSFYAGQFIHVTFTDLNHATQMRSYSIASSPSDNFIECHIKLIPGGAFSTLAFEHFKVGDALNLQGPFGCCIYSAVDRRQPLLLAAIGTGLAPIYGILKDAIAAEHQGPIHVLVGAKNQTGFYLTAELEKLAQAHANIQLVWLAQESVGFAAHSDIYAYCKDQFPSLTGFGIYVCGSESFVKKLKKQCFLAGASMKEIYADAFTASGV